MITKWNVLLALLRKFDRTKQLPFRRCFSSTGLYGIPELANPSGFHQLSLGALHQSERLVAEALSAGRTRKMVQIFDDLSNSICCVADLAECVRHTHPVSHYVDAAERCVATMQHLVESLNAHPELYRALQQSVLTDRERLSDVDHRVITLLLADFEASAVHLPVDKRARFVDLTQRIFQASTKYTEGVHRPRLALRRQLPVPMQAKFHAKGDYSVIDCAHAEDVDPHVREWAYRLYNAPDDAQEQHLKTLVSLRHELAQMCGFRSFAHRALQRSYLESPEQAMSFLCELSDRLKPKVQDELAEMQMTMNAELGASSKRQLAIWDVSYYVELLRRKKYWIALQEISDALTLSSLLWSLNGLLQQQFGVRLDKVPTVAGELWHDSVFKLVVSSTDDSTALGYVYCDLYARQGKLHDCHYTIRGGRRQADGSYQMPVVTLVLGLQRADRVSIAEADNFFHEMGHALHSVLGRTQYQHVTGTRCPTDFAEVPSNMMEYMFKDARVMNTLLNPRDDVRSPPTETAHLFAAAHGIFSACALQTQLLYAILDLRLHMDPPSSEASTTRLVADVSAQHSSLPHAPNTAWHHRFSHLVIYGAKYHSYLVARAVASLLWHQCFQKDPFSREAGERYRRELLAHGGERSPAELICGVLGWTPKPKDLVDALLLDCDSKHS